MKSRKSASGIFTETARWLPLVLVTLTVMLAITGANTTTTVPFSACIGETGYTCTHFVIATSGNASFTFVQSTGSTLYNVGVACISSSSSFPPSEVSYLPLQQGPIPNGQSVNVAGLPCYGQNGRLGPQSPGIQFTGYIWINYTANAIPSPENPPILQKAATGSASVTDANSYAYTSSATTTIYQTSPSGSTAPSTTVYQNNSNPAANATSSLTTSSTTSTAQTTSSASTIMAVKASSSSLGSTTIAQQSASGGGWISEFINGIATFLKKLFRGL